ncbi:hypothetical protein [Rhizobium straminoryzae]|uniref:Uncharacterized protein n=1 Tax=Rhizobium straminoryzae TaxID=1387186 RepID=A0A549TCW4_9HYPH|nr:hypothetical protein [Rhizobium straminoryzae]TRL39817.1 hypothetical protein FNA46_07730 [Rhizobium straminoryzae]
MAKIEINPEDAQYDAVEVADVVEALAASGLASIDALRQAGYQPVASGGTALSSNNSPQSTQINQVSYRKKHTLAVDCSNFILVYANYGTASPGIMEAGYSPINVTAAMDKLGSTETANDGHTVPVAFNGSRRARVDPGCVLFSDPVFLPLSKGERFYTKTASDTFAVPAPDAPAVSASGTGGALAAGASYLISVCYIFADGSESLLSAGSVATIPAGASTGSITVTSPAAYPGAIAYRVCIGSRNATTGVQAAYAKACQEGLAAIGQPKTIIREQTAGARTRLIGGAAGRASGGGIRDVGEVASLGDRTIPGATLDVSASPNNIYTPLTILGRPKRPCASVAIVADSKGAGTGDGGVGYGEGGFIVRGITNRLDLKMQDQTTPLCGYIPMGLGGEKLDDFVNSLASSVRDRTRNRLAELANNIISNYGNNDKGLGFSTFRANLLKAVSWYAPRGIKWHQMTLPPSTNTTDAWTTVAGQTKVSTEATRLQINAWLRDTGPSGFRQESGYFDLTGVIETCSAVEVNASNVKTLDGGYVIVPAARPSITGTLTGVTAKYEFIDSSKAGWVADLYKGYSIRFTTGAAANTAAGVIFYTRADGTINVDAGWSATPAVGDAYEITFVAAIDAAHDSTWAHIEIGKVIRDYVLAGNLRVS